MIRGYLGKLHDRCAFDNFDVDDTNRDAFEACKRVAAGNGGIVLFGPVGRGKTHLLAALAKAFDERVSNRSIEEPPSSWPMPNIHQLMAQYEAETNGKVPTLTADEIGNEAHIEFWPILDLVSELRQEIKMGDFTVSERCRNCDLLILDDLGQERVTDFVLEELERIIDWRYRNMLPIAISTNLTVKQLSDPAKYGERSISRWVESCELVWVGGRDHRKGMTK